MNQSLEQSHSSGPFGHFTIIPDEYFEKAHSSEGEAARSGRAVFMNDKFGNDNFQLERYYLPDPVGASSGPDDEHRDLYFVEFECSDGSTATPAWDKDMKLVGVAFRQPNPLHPQAKGAFVVDFSGKVIAEKR